MIQNMIISIFQGRLQTENIRSHRNKVWNSRSPEIKGGGGRGFRILIFNLVTIHPIGDYDSRICTLGYHYS